MKFLIGILALLILALAGCSTQTTVKYQCADGSFVDSANLRSSKTCPEVNCPKVDCDSCPVKTENKILRVDCPQLNEINVFEWRSILGSTYMRLNNSYNGVNLQGYNVTWSFYVQCEKGKDEGDNINWWYCGKYYYPLLYFIHLKKMIINNNGEIIEIINKKAHNIYNENFEFIKTECVE